LHSSALIEQCRSGRLSRCRPFLRSRVHRRAPTVRMRARGRINIVIRRIARLLSVRVRHGRNVRGGAGASRRGNTADRCKGGLFPVKRWARCNRHVNNELREVLGSIRHRTTRDAECCARVMPDPSASHADHLSRMARADGGHADARAFRASGVFERNRRNWLRVRTGRPSVSRAIGCRSTTRRSPAVAELPCAT
jgi:hypothetical protein